MEPDPNRRVALYCFAIVVVALILSPNHFSAGPDSRAAAAQGPTAARRPSEAALRLNNLGIAEMEQFHFTQAAAYFDKARAQAPELEAATVNLALALFYDRKNDQAERLLKGVIARDPKQTEARYVLALLYRSTGKNEEALEQMRAVLQLDQRDPAALYFAGSLNSALHHWDEAIRYLRSSLERDPINVSIYYALATSLVQKGDSGQAEKVMAQFQELKSRGTGTSFGNQYMEQGRYAQAVRVSSGQNFGAAVGRPRFANVSSTSGISFVHAGPRDQSLFDAAGHLDLSPGNAAAFGSGVVFFDFDGDNWPDLFFANASPSKRLVGGVPAPPACALYRNKQGVFSLVRGSGIDFQGVAMGVAAGDYDNDGHPDLFIAGLNGSALYHNEGNGKFTDKTSLLSPALRQAWALTPAFIDLDHDGDLDLFVTCAGQRNLLFRNNGDGTFAETGEKSGTAGGGPTASAAFLDYNESRDIDVLLVDTQRWRLLSNKRDGTFADVSESAGLTATPQVLGVAVGDFDSDGLVDVCSAAPDRAGAVRIFWNTGAQYKSEEVAIASRDRFWNARALDYDNDGDLDILLAGDSLRLLDNNGRRGFQDVTAAVGLDKVDAAGSRGLAIADYDRDGDLDIVVNRCGRAPLVIRNDGGNRNHFFRVALRGKADNGFGIGAKVDWAAGGLWQHREFDGGAGYLGQGVGEVLLGLGRFLRPDYVRVLWPTGVLQTEIPPRNVDRLELTQLDRKGTSCPILYAWNGSAYQFVTDFLGGSAMGYLEEPGRYGVPDTDEYVKIPADQLRVKGDRLSLKMVNQLEEVMLFDAVRLLAVDHPSGMEVFPNERLMAAPPFPEFRIYTAAAARPVVAASDEKGVFWTRSLAEVDRDYVRGFNLLQFKGYAEEHSLILDLGDLRNASRSLLLMDGWIDYANSTSNFAAAQAGLKLIPPYLQVLERGHWKTVLADMGFPAGLPKTMTVDLSGRLPQSERTLIRIVTNMRIYWDRIRLETSPQDPRLEVTEMAASGARTAWVGYPREWSPDGRQPFYYDYARRDASAPWKMHGGGYTPLGDVRKLLSAVDDHYVILPHGEEIEVEFAAKDLPRLPEGWTRDWLLYVDGFGKDMDLHSQHPDTVEPLPRHLKAGVEGSSDQGAKGRPAGARAENRGRGVEE